MGTEYFKYGLYSVFCRTECVLWCFPETFSGSCNQTWKVLGQQRPVIYIITTEVLCHCRGIHRIFFSSLLKYNMTLCHWVGVSPTFWMITVPSSGSSSLRVRPWWLRHRDSLKYELLAHRRCCITAPLRKPQITPSVFFMTCSSILCLWFRAS